LFSRNFTKGFIYFIYHSLWRQLHVGKIKRRLRSWTKSPSCKT